MNRIFVILQITMLLMLTGCSSIAVKSDYDQTTDFSQYKTYQWLEKGGNSSITQRNPLAAQKIVGAVEREMQLKGLKKSVGEAADLLLTFHAGVQDKVDVTAYGYNYWRPRRGLGITTVDVNRYKEGTLIIDVIDAREKQLIWRGWGSGVIGDPGNVGEKIEKAVTKILEEYPSN